MPKSKGIDQDSDLYMGFKNHTRHLKIKIWYVEKRIIDQLTRMLITLVQYIKSDSQVLINIVSDNNEIVSQLSLDLGDLVKLNLKDTEPDTVNKIRHFYKVDTVGEALTYIEKKGFPRFAGIGPAMPKSGDTKADLDATIAAFKKV
jgi:hypothetical protein